MSSTNDLRAATTAASLATPVGELRVRSKCFWVVSHRVRVVFVGVCPEILSELIQRSKRVCHVCRQYRSHGSGGLPSEGQKATDGAARLISTELRQKITHNTSEENEPVIPFIF